MKMKSLFKASRIGLVFLIAFLTAYVLYQIRPKADRQPVAESGTLVEVRAATAEQIDMRVEAYGTVKPREVLKLVAQVRGQVVALLPSFDEGGFVTAGTPLVTIDQRTYQLEVDRRQVQIEQVAADLKRLGQEISNLTASIGIAENDMALARREFTRLEKLEGRNVVARTTRDKAEQRYLASMERLQQLNNQMALTGPATEQLAAAAKMAQVQLRQAMLDLERTQVLAAFDGWVLEKSVEAGQHVNTGAYLGSIYRDGALDVEAQIAVKDMRWLSADGAPASPLVVDITLGNTAGSPSWQGRVVRAKARLDEKTRALPLVVEVKTSAAGQGGLDRLRPGMFVRLEIKGRRFAPVFRLPRHLLYPGDLVYILTGSLLRVKKVDVLRRFKDEVIIKAGLAPGDLIITTILARGVDGMRVRRKASGGS